MKIELCRNERRDKDTVKTKLNKKKVIIAAAILALITVGVVFHIVTSKDSWLTKSTIQRRALPADQCQRSDNWYLNDAGNCFPNGEEEYIISGMEYFYEKTGVQPFLWVTYYPVTYMSATLEASTTKNPTMQLMTNKYEELFGSDGGHVIVAISKSTKVNGIYYWQCLPGENAKQQVMDEEAQQILKDCLSYMYEPASAHPGRTVGDAFVKAADTMMIDQSFQSYAYAIIVVGALVFIAVICVASIRRSGKENVAYHKTLKAREEARKEEAIAEQKQADLDRKKYEDELETQYMAIPCPNCGGSGNKIRKGTVGICKFCGTAIKVGRDGKIEFLSNDE